MPDKMLPALLAGALLLGAGAASAQAPAAKPAAAQPAPVAVEGVWARAVLPGQVSSGAYMTLLAREPLTVLGAESPAAGIVEVHQMKMENGVMRMRAVDSLALVPGQPLVFAPGGYHFMLMDLKAPFAAGSRVPLTVRLRDAQGAERRLELSLPVQAAAPRPGHAR
jgi:copper(I)-binding protein